MTVPRDIDDPVRGLGSARRALGDGTFGGRVRSATPWTPRPIGGEVAVSTPGNAAPFIDTLTLTANSQQVASGGDFVTWHNELVGLTPRDGFEGYGGPGETVTIPADGRLLPRLHLDRSSGTGATGWTVRWHVTRGAQTLTDTVVGPASGGVFLDDHPGLSVKAGDVLRIEIVQASGGAETLDGARLDLTLLRKAVRSAAAFDPGQLGPTAWFKADALDLADGAAVASWVDSSGNGFDAAQGTAARQPTYRANVRGTMPGVEFDGGDDLLTSGVPQTVTAAYTVVAVVRIDAVPPDATGSADDNVPIAYLGDPVSNGYGLFAREDGNQGVLHGGNNYLVDGAIAVADTRLFVARRSAGTTSLRLDRSAETITNTGTAVTAPTGSFKVAGTGAASTLRLDGMVFEELLFDRALTDDEVQQLETFLASKWGL